MQRFLAGAMVFCMLFSQSTQAQERVPASGGFLWNYLRQDGVLACIRVSQELYGDGHEADVRLISAELIDASRDHFSCLDKFGTLHTFVGHSSADYFVLKDAPHQPGLLISKENPQRPDVASKICRNIDPLFEVVQSRTYRDYIEVTCEAPLALRRNGKPWYATQKVRAVDGGALDHSTDAEVPVDALSLSYRSPSNAMKTESGSTTVIAMREHLVHQGQTACGSEDALQSITTLERPDWFLATCKIGTISKAVPYFGFAALYLRFNDPLHPDLSETHEDPRDRAGATRVCRQTNARLSAAQTTEHGTYYEIRCEAILPYNKSGDMVYFLTRNVRYVR